MPDSNATIYIIIFGCLLMTIMGVAIISIAFIYQRNMRKKERVLREMEQEKQIIVFKASFEAEERQKEKIASNLHDSINPTLTALSLRLSSHQSNYCKNNFKPTDLNSDIDLINETINEIRFACHDLVPGYFYDYGLLKTLEQLIRNCNTPNLIQSKININELLQEQILLTEMEQLNIYRVSQEIVNNFIKHSKCSQLLLSVYLNDNMLILDFNHNGVGLTDSEVEKLSYKGLGLKSLRSRIMILKGKINYTNTELIKVKLQIPNSSHAIN